jgi:hypothetical protein
MDCIHSDALTLKTIGERERERERKREEETERVRD